jgi:hypothetical protein
MLCNVSVVAYPAVKLNNLRLGISGPGQVTDGSNKGLGVAITDFSNLGLNSHGRV